MAESLKAKTPDSILENNKIKAIYPHIVVTGEIDKPYYSIAYYDTEKKEWYIGYSSYDLKYVRQWFDEFFEEVEGDIAEVVHAYWVRNAPNPESMRTLHKTGIAKAMGENSIYWTCSCCNEWGHPYDKYCSNCGAKMDASDINVGTKTNLPDDVRQNILNTFMKGSED